VSIQHIQQDPQDTSNFYLANIYQALANPTQSNISSSLPASPPPFSPPTYAVWVNTLWFLSLVISLTCALLATLLQQWARRYLKVTQSRYSLHKRARIRAFLAEGVERLLLPCTVETLPTLLHISLFLFFAGLVVFLWNVHLTIFKLVLSWVGICMAVYGCITFMPIFCHDSPYHTPLSSPVWHIVTRIPSLTFRALRRLAHLKYFSAEAYHHFDDLAKSYGKWLVQGMQKTIEETALKLPSEIDTRTFLWTFNSLDEDHELECFFSGLPGFRTSKVVNDPLPSLTEEIKVGLFTALTGLLDRTFSSDLLSEPIKNRRAMICTKAIDLAHTTEALSILNGILFKCQYYVPLVAEIAQIFRDWGISMDDDAILYAQATISKVVARVQSRNDTWYRLASKSLGVPDMVLRDYAAHGDSLSLAILIHITHQQFSHYHKKSWPEDEFLKVLEAASKFNVQDTSPELQHKFCALWNQIVHKVQNDQSRWMAFQILAPIRNIYIALHQDTDSAPKQFSPSTGDRDDILKEPDSYPVCNIPGHHLDLTPQAHIRGVSAAASATFAPAIPHDHDDNTTPTPHFLASGPDKPFTSTGTYAQRLRFYESPAQIGPLLPVSNFKSRLSPPVPVSASDYYLQPVDQTTTEVTESRHIPAASPNPVSQPAFGHTPAGMMPVFQVIPRVIPSTSMQMHWDMHMHTSELEQQQQQQPPVIPHDMGPGSPNPMSMPSPARAAWGLTPSTGISTVGLMTPAVVPGTLPPGFVMDGLGLEGMGSGKTTPESIAASPAVEPMSIPTPAVGLQMQMGMGMPLPGGAVVPTVRFNGYTSEYLGLLYHSPHMVLYEDELYPTALHLFGALKFLEHRPDIADRIRLCEHVEDVTAMSASFAEHTRRDWGNVALDTVRFFSLVCK
jgi:hypothetical protein